MSGFRSFPCYGAQRSAQIGMIMKKVTLQDIASSLGISRTTVWKVFSGQKGVSDNLRRKILTTAQEMGYEFPECAPLLPSQKTAAPPVNIAVAVCRPESSIFWMNIIHQIAKELSFHNVNLVYTYLPSSIDEDYTLPASLVNGNTHGIIVLNVYNNQLIRLLSEAPVPKVFLDTVPRMQPPELHGDLVLIEGRTCIREITRRLIDSGRTRLGFVGDIGYAQTNQDRYEGFADALREKNLPLDASLCLTAPLSLRAHYEEISAFLDGLPELPQAIVCASDFIAHFVSRYLTESGRKTPKGFLLTGFDNNAEYGNVADKITTVHVETSALGKRLANKLLFRADHPQMPPEVCYITTEIVYRGPLAAETEK